MALIGQECVYYNDIEDGFNTSRYQTAGRIEDYYCNQPDLLSFMDACYEDFIAANTSAA